MAQLKDTVVSGSLRATDTIYSTTGQFNIIKAPTVSGGTDFGIGTTGYVLKTGANGVYWGSDNNSDVNVKQLAAITTSGAYPIILANSTATTEVTGTVNKSSTLTYNPNTYELAVNSVKIKQAATGFTIAGGSTTSKTLTVNNTYTLGGACEKSVETSISAASTSTNLPTSQAVASFVEGKGYTTNTGTVTSITIKTTSPLTGGSNTATTTSGTYTLALADNYGDTKNPYASKTKNYVLAASSTENSVPSFRALTAADIPSLNASKINDGTFDATRIPSLAASKIGSGTLPIGRGGTGTSTNPIQGGVIYASSTTTYDSTAVGTSGQFLKSQGTATPVWNDITYPDIKPIISKVYAPSNSYGTADSDATCCFFFMSIKPDSWYKSWQVRFKVRTVCDSYANGDSTSWVTFNGRADGIIYHNWNERYDTAHYYISIRTLKSAGFNSGLGHMVGVNVRYGYKRGDSAYTRKFYVDYYDCEGCVVTILNSANLWANLGDTNSFSDTNYNGYTNTDGYNRGLAESNDANTTSISNLTFNNGYFKAKKAIYRYQLLFHTDDDYLSPLNTNNNDTGTSKTLFIGSNADAITFDPLKPIYYWNTTSGVSAEANIGVGSLLYSVSGFDLRYSFNCGSSSFTAHKNLYLKTIMQSDGKVKIDGTTPLTQTLPSDNDGYYYILLGRTYSAYQTSLYPDKPVYYHNGTTLVRYYGKEIGGNAATATTATTLSSTLPVSKGGTGLTTSTNLNAVVIGNSTTATNAFQTVATASGAFYATSANAKPTFGALPIAQGGTGKTSASDAWAALGGGASGTHADSYFALASHGIHVPDNGTSNNNKFLKAGSTSGSVSWASLSKSDVGLDNVTNDAQIAKSIGTTKGDIIYFTGNAAPARLGIGTAGYFLKATANGPAWANTTDITTVGTISTGTWQGTKIGVTYGGTGKNSIAIYAMLYASAANTYAEISPNTTATKKFLRMTGSGSTGAAPAWDTLVAGDIPDLSATKITSDTFDAARIPTLSITDKTSGTLTVARGGTGATAATQGGIIYASSTTAYASTAAGTSGQYLKSNGTGAPTWASFSASTVGLGNVTNDAQVKKAGDTMTGDLTINHTSAESKLSIGNADTLAISTIADGTKSYIAHNKSTSNPVWAAYFSFDNVNRTITTEKTMYFTNWAATRSNLHITYAATLPTEGMVEGDICFLPSE